MANLNDILDSMNNLSIGEQETLMNILTHRLSERRRASHTCSAEIAVAIPAKSGSKTIDEIDIMGEIGGDE